MPDDVDQGWAVALVRPGAWRALRRESDAGRFGGSLSSVRGIIGTAKQDAEDHHVGDDRGGDDDDGDVIGGAQVAHDAGAASLHERVGEIDEANDAYSPRERDPEPRARPKRCHGRKREHGGERRPEGGGYREALRERRPYQRRREEAQADVAEGLYHKQRLKGGLSWQARESRCDIPTRQQTDRGEREHN